MACLANAAPAPSIDHGNAGASAQAKYERLHQRREQAIDEKWGRFAGVVKFLTDDPQSTKAWHQGSIGERKLAASLKRDLDDRLILLNDCRVPKTRGNIDHIAIAASGVWIIDTKRYSGRVERRDVGRWFEVDERLFVGGRDQTKLTHAMGWQLDAVRTVLLDVNVPITPVVCFVDAEWGLFTKPIRMNGVVVVWRKKLAEMIGAPGPLSGDEVREIATRISVALPPVK